MQPKIKNYVFKIDKNTVVFIVVKENFESSNTATTCIKDFQLKVN